MGDIQDKKEVVYYGVLVKSWMNNSLVHDIAIFAFSLVCIVMFIFIPYGIDSKKSIYDIMLITTRLGLAFSAQSIVMCVLIFENNAKYIEDLIKDKEPKSLKKYDIYNKISFLSSVLLLLTSSVLRYI